MTAAEFESAAAAGDLDVELMPSLPVGRLRVPGVMKLSPDGSLLLHQPSVDVRDVIVPRDLLLQFTRLAGGTSADVLAFARRYGPLRLCAAHGLWREHRHPPAGRSFHPICDGYSVRGLDEENPFEWHGEEVQSWITLARQAAHVLELSSLIWRRRALPADWLTATIGERPLEQYPMAAGGSFIAAGAMGPIAAAAMAKVEAAVKDTPPAPPFGHAWAVLVGIVASWLEWGNVKPVLRAERPGRAQLMMGGGLLFGTLALQLMTALSSKGFAFCDGCHRAFRPTRQPRGSEDTYCLACRKSGKPKAAAVSRHNERLRQARELIAQGEPLDEVAHRTGLRAKTVRDRFGRRGMRTSR